MRARTRSYTTTRRLIVLAVAFSSALPASQARPAETEIGRRWPADRCDATPRDRPALISAYFAGDKWGPPKWRYREALRALKRAGVPTRVMEKNGPKRWDDFATAAGTVGKLVPAARRLERQRAPRPGLYRPDASIECAGHRDNSKEFTIWIPKGTHARQVIARHGGRERITERWGFGHAGLHMWTLRRRPISGTVQRAIAYLRDRDVYYVEVQSDRGYAPD
ncbi:MAG: hypothetical protein M3238_00550 [Actinomycetota bacterium]|nr:hypothetical protein [Actinomycetota bacterium]